MGSRIGFHSRRRREIRKPHGRYRSNVRFDYRIPGRLAIVLDNQLESAPTVKQRIDGGSAVISGNFSYREAKLLSDILNNPLKVSLEIGEKYEVSPTLATSALDSSLSACYLGAFLVIAFMIVWYRSGGFVAVFSVGTNVLLVVALLAGIFQATFTLPGMAALVLTIGMAVDANILIFERIREELRAGKSTENALEGEATPKRSPLSSTPMSRL